MSDAPSFPRPSPSAVVGRTLVLTVLQLRLIQEATIREGDSAQKQEARAMTEALGSFGPMFEAKRIISIKESMLFNSALGTWPDQEGINIDWRQECVGVFGWALGIEPTILPYDKRFEVNTKSYMDQMLGFIKRNDAQL